MFTVLLIIYLALAPTPQSQSNTVADSVVGSSSPRHRLMIHFIQYGFTIEGVNSPAKIP